jgi:hypothetical protein
MAENAAGVTDQSSEFSLFDISLLNIFFKKLFPLLPVPPKITPFFFGEEPMNYGDTVSVQCIITGGDLPVSIHWLWNNKTIDELYFSNDIQIEKRGKKISMLSIEAVTAKHIGTFSCIAKNHAGITEHSSDLNVNGIV